MPIEYVSLMDLFLVPVYFFLLLGLMYYIRKKYPKNYFISHYLVKAFVFKMGASLFYALLVYFYYNTGDTMSYFREAMSVRQQLDQGNESLGVFLRSYDQVKDVYAIIGAANEGSWIMEKFVILLTYFTFSRFLVTTMVFATIMLSGMLKMAETFAELMPEWKKYIAWVVLFFPSLAVYGSGILKDSVCMASMGWLLYSANRFFKHREHSVGNIIIILVSVTLIAMIKVYIIAAFIIPFLVYSFLLYVKGIHNKLVRNLAFPFLLLVVCMLYFTFEDSLNKLLGNYAAENLLETVSVEQNKYLTQKGGEEGAVFNLGTMEPTAAGFLKMMPSGVVATMFRPFIWESRKMLMLFSAIESLFMLIFTGYVIWKTGIAFFFRKIASEPFIFLCITFTIIFASLVGLSTYNFGTLARYRIPAIPFYIMGLLNILYLHYKKHHPAVVAARP